MSTNHSNSNEGVLCLTHQIITKCLLQYINEAWVFMSKHVNDVSLINSLLAVVVFHVKCLKCRKALLTVTPALMIYYHSRDE